VYLILAYLQAPSKKAGKKVALAAKKSGPTKVAKVCDPAVSRFFFELLTGRLERGIQEEASWCVGHDPVNHDQQRKHQREPAEALD
jgi:hypothetical protein